MSNPIDNAIERIEARLSANWKSGIVHDIRKSDIKSLINAYRDTGWISVRTPPQHRNDVLIKARDGSIGIGWWNQCKAQKLTILYLASKDPKPTFEEQIAAREIIEWRDLPPKEQA